jgi:hypothetical protein
MEQSKIQENERKLREFCRRKFEAGEISNDGLVELFKDMGSYLNLQTISDYARDHNMSYPGVVKGRRVEEIFNVKFVVDNY